MTMSLADVKPASRFKSLHVGRSGSGKTVGAASIAFLAPPGEKVYFFDNDGRMRPIMKMYPELVNKIDFDSYTSNDFEKLYDKIGWLLDNPDKYWAVVMDGLTMLSDMTIDYAIGINTKGGAKRKTDLGVLRMPEIQEYKAETRGMSYVLDELRTFPRHFIMTAHLMQVEYKKMVKGKGEGGEETQIERLLVTAGRKIAPKIPLYFDEVYLFYPWVGGSLTTPPEFRVYTAANEQFVECRSALKLPIELDWNNKQLYPLIIEEARKHFPDQVQALLEK